MATVAVKPTSELLDSAGCKVDFCVLQKCADLEVRAYYDGKDDQNIMTVFL